MANCAPTTDATAAPRRRPRRGYLATPLTPEEQRRVALMYREHQGLLRLLGRKLCRKYPCVDSADIFSCIDQAFIKSCRAFNPQLGRFSTLLTSFSEGDILHFIRDGNWSVKAPGAVRRIGQLSRRMLERGESAANICATLGISLEQMKLALVATSPTDHDIRGFDLHVCPRPTPWDTLEAEEAI